MATITSRVYYFGKQFRQSIKAARIEKGCTQEAFFQNAVDAHLPGIVQTLVDMGFQPGKRTGPIKVPMAEGTLRVLRNASSKSGIPQTALLQSCIIQATGKKKAAAKRKRRRGPTTQRK